MIDPPRGHAHGTGALCAPQWCETHAMAFLEWLARQTWRRDAVGDLARDTRNDRTWPPTGKISRARLHAHLERNHAIPAALTALDTAWNEWDQQRRATRNA
jgi:uncharacterized protein YozE (UPF0346 family)